MLGHQVSSPTDQVSPNLIAMLMGMGLEARVALILSMYRMGMINICMKITFDDKNKLEIETILY